MKTKNSLLAVLLLTFTIALAAQERGEINFFNGTLEEALTSSAELKKPLFLEGYTDWCGYCKKLERETFTDKTVADHINSTYIAIKIDLEKGNGPAIAKKYGITGFPTMIVIGTDGTVDKKIVGYKTPEQLLKQLK